jgi:hypothetical protein
MKSAEAFLASTKRKKRSKVTLILERSNYSKYVYQTFLLFLTHFYLFLQRMKKSQQAPKEKVVTPGDQVTQAKQKFAAKVNFKPNRILILESSHYFDRLTIIYPF